MEKAIPSSPTSAVDTSPVQATPKPLTGRAFEMATAHRLARGIAETMMQMACCEGGEIVDEKRWNLFLAMLGSADHELGRAVR